jgi:hypothetical protein
MASDTAVPAVGVTDCVAEVSEPLEYVIVYAVPEVPEIPRPVNVATPFTAVAVVVPTRVAPADTDAVTTVELSDVSVFPPPSVIVTCGWVVKAAPDEAPAEERESESAAAEPAPVMVTSDVDTLCSVDEVRTSRCELPTVPLRRAAEKSSRPLDALIVVVPDSPVDEVVVRAAYWGDP